MGPQAPGSFDPDNLNPYPYAGNDPINNVDSGTGEPTKPPLPGQNQNSAVPDKPIDWDFLHCPGCAQMWRAADAAGNDLAIGTAAVSAFPAGATALGWAAQTAPAAYSATGTAIGAAAETYVPGGVQAVTDFAAGFVNSTSPPASWAGQIGAAVSDTLSLWNGN